MISCPPHPTREMTQPEAKVFCLVPGQSTALASLEEERLILVIAGSLDTSVETCKYLHPLGMLFQAAQFPRLAFAGTTGAFGISISWRPEAKAQQRLSVHRISNAEIAASAMACAWACHNGSGSNQLTPLSSRVQSLTAEHIAAAPRRPPQDWVMQTERSLEEQYRDPPSIRELAAQVHVDPSHLARTFRRVHQRTIGDSIRLRRVELAMHALNQSEDKLIAIASRLGFADQAHFCRSFKRIVGVPPSRYREIVRTRLSPAGSAPLHSGQVLDTSHQIERSTDRAPRPR